MCWGCCDNALQTGSLKQQKFILSWFWGPGAQNPGVGRAGPEAEASWGSSSRPRPPAARSPVAVAPHARLGLCHHRELFPGLSVLPLKDTSQGLGLTPILTTSAYLDDTCKHSISK